MKDVSTCLFLISKLVVRSVHFLEINPKKTLVLIGLNKILCFYRVIETLA